MSCLLFPAHRLVIYDTDRDDCIREYGNVGYYTKIVSGSAGGDLVGDVVISTIKVANRTLVRF